MKNTNIYTYIGPGISQDGNTRYTIVSEKENSINSRDASIIKKDIGLINESIGRILNTKAWNPNNNTGGERFMELDFGSRLSEIPFEPNDPITVSLLKQFINESVGKWEPRITILETVVEQDVDNHLIKATIYYVVILQEQIVQAETQIKIL